MININSPVINNMMGMSNNVPINPIGSIGIGNQGYNGGYYNNLYNGYYNPYLLQKQEELRKAQERDFYNQQANIWKMVSRGCNNYFGTHQDDMDEHLRRYDYVEPEQQNPELQVTLKLMQLEVTGSYVNPMMMNFVANNNRIYDQAKQAFPDSMGLMEFLENAGTLYNEAISAEHKEKMKDTSKLYKSSEFNNLLSLHNSGNRFNGFGSLNKEITIEDMEITLPTKLQTEYQERRQKFLNAILNKG